MKTKFVALYRVSTQKQGDSQLGLKAQKQSVDAYVRGIEGEIIYEVTEVESAGNKDRINTKNRSLSYDLLLNKRPQLKKAIELAEKNNAILIVKEPSRLTRFSILMGFLIEYKIKFICADCANDSEMILKMKTLFAEDELVKISQRTKAALEQKKKAGVKLGNNGHGMPSITRLMGVEAIKKAALEAKENVQAMDIICRERKDGKTLQEIADKLNRLRYRTRRGKEFKQTTVLRLFERC